MPVPAIDRDEALGQVLDDLARFPEEELEPWILVLLKLRQASTNASDAEKGRE